MDVVGVRGSGEWLGVDMGDPVGDKVNEPLDKLLSLDKLKGCQ